VTGYLDFEILTLEPANPPQPSPFAPE
jgi:hypothetical protein